MINEPLSHYEIGPRTAVGLVAAARLNPLTALSLHAGLARNARESRPAIRPLALQVGSRLIKLATALRDPRLPPLRETQMALRKFSDKAFIDETTLLVDSIDTMGELLERDVEVGSA